jgi:hypothetical protein
MEFTGLDRIALLFNDIFPTVGDIMLYGLVEAAQTALRFTNDELTLIEYKRIDERQFSYSVQKAAELVIEVEIPPLLANELWKKLEELNSQKRLAFAMVPLYYKFKKLMKDDEGFA